MLSVRFEDGDRSKQRRPNDGNRRGNPANSSSRAWPHKERRSAKPQQSGGVEPAREVQNVELKDLVYHAFLPKQVPDNAQPNLVDIEDMMLGYMLHVLSEGSADLVQVMGPVKSMFERWRKIQPKWYSEADQDRFAHFFKQEVRRMQDGETFPLYIRRQNCVMIITKLDEQSTRVDTFRTMLPSEMVMSTVGSFTVAFPQTSDFIYNKDLLISDAFMRHVHELCVHEFEISLPTCKKGETTYTDYRDVADPFLVSDWLVGALVPSTAACVEGQQPHFQILKKVRDEVICQMSARAIPFRRSGMWMAIKVALQLKLTTVVGNESNAKMLYKIIMLRALAYICQQYAAAAGANQCNNIDWDLASQMMAKIGRRVDKLQGMKYDEGDSESVPRLKIDDLKTACLGFVHSVISDLHQQVTGMWRKAASSHSIIKPVARSAEDFQKDLQHEIAWLDDLTEKRNAKDVAAKKAKAKYTKLQNQQKAAALETSEDIVRSMNLQRHLTAESILKSKDSFNYYSEMDGINERIWLHDTENFIKNFNDDEGSSAKTLSDIILAYVRISVPRYFKDSNPVSCSQMVLVLLKAIQVLDKVATNKFPLLLEYKSGIECQLFEKLLLPYKTDMKLLDEVLNYFEARNSSAHLPSFLENNKISGNSFPVRFALENESMVQIRNRILQDTQAAIDDKLSHVSAVREECQRLQRELAILQPCNRSCSATEHDNKTGTRALKTITCRRCSIHRGLKWKRHSIPVYERPLPPEEHRQLAVIFELKAPHEISVLRDLLALLNFEMFGQIIFNGGQRRFDENSKSPPVTFWTDYLKGRGKTEDYKSDIGNRLGTVTLVSPKFAASGTCYTQIHNPDVLDPNSHFVIDNDLNSIYYHEKPLWYPTHKRAEDVYTFQMSSTSKNAPYQNLQWTVGSTTHSQNSVIARKDLCHRELSMEEFIAFGSLRTGHRNQIRNLYRCVYDRALSLEKEPVLALILQTLWQIGPNNDDGIRDTHVGFEEPEFVLGFLEMLEEFIESVKSNYSEPLPMMTAVAIIVRVVEVNEEFRDECCTLLRSIRGILAEWIRKLEEKLADPLNADDASTIKFLKSRLMEATICSAFSYNVFGSELVQTVMQNCDDYVHWFHTVSGLHRLTQEDQCLESISQFSQTLLFCAKNVALNLNLEEDLDSNNAIHLSLNKFACEKWNKAQECERSGDSWEALQNHNHLVVGRYDEDTGTVTKAKHYIHFDFILGTFLVNGFPESTLQPGVADHPLFRRFFKDSQIKVQRYSECARTIDKFHGKHYDFEVSLRAVKSGSSLKVELDNLVIREVQEDGTTLEMLEPALFSKIGGTSLKDNYTHWLDPKEKKVYFRRLAVKDSDYALPPDYILFKDGSCENWKCYDVRVRKLLLSVNSEGFKMISGALSRIEAREEISIMMDQETGLVTAKLPRYRLSFDVVEDRLQSVEYLNFKVSADQNMGTLIGLQQGILMEFGPSPDKFSKRILIVPHGYLLTRQIQHQQTSINLDKLRQPPFFAYEYDTVLRRLNADKSKAAWLYLAALHASTSSSLPDPFTQATGVEFAVDILQSGRVWSSSPFDKESYNTLEMIRSFSPSRSYYGHKSSLFSSTVKVSEKMGITQWPEVLPPMAAYDGYAFIVDKLIADSQQLQELFPQLQNGKPRKQEKDAGDSEKLQVRAYLRHLSSYNQSVCVRPELMMESSAGMIGTGKIFRCGLRERDLGSDGFYLGQLLDISQTRYVNTFQRMKKVKNGTSLASFLLTMDPIAMPDFTGFENLPLKDLLNLEFRPNWLQLYASAVSGKDLEEGHAFTLVLSALAYRGAPMDQLANIHHISVLANSVDFPPVPSFPKPNPPGAEDGNENLIIPSLCDFVDEEIENILVDSAKSLADDANTTTTTPEDYLVKLELHKDKIKEDASRITSALRTYWPCAKIQSVKELFHQTDIVYENAIEDINRKINFWYRNLKFSLFVQEVEEKLNSTLNALSSDIQQAQELYNQYQFARLSRVEMRAEVTLDKSNEICLESLMQNSLEERRMEEARDIFKTGRLKIEEESKKSLEDRRSIYVDKIKDFMKGVEEILTNSTIRQILSKSGVMPRAIPGKLLHYLRENWTRGSTSLVIYVGALAVLWTHVKRLNRCIALVTKGKNKSLELNKELANQGHENWSPADHTDWLLLELELDILIRDIQVRVANQMICMPGDKNGVMQLNMGEGKTSVIVPMLCCALANEESLCRVTVLPSIFKTNLDILTFAIGGLLNKRVYTIPCRRDLDLNESTVTRMNKALKECMRMKGVLLALPEYRLSFRLLAYDKIIKGDHRIGTRLMETENWMRYYCRDVLDESDELLNVKYQLVYTIGERRAIDGGNLRWTTCQKILQAVQDIAADLFDEFGSGVVEFDKRARSSEQFTMIRLLSNECLQKFTESVANEVLKEMKLSATQKRFVKMFLTHEELLLKDHNLLLALFPDTSDTLNKILLASAYLSRGILSLALSKRWRVEYGVDPKGRLRMAVPFRAKDVAAERTEFGHPDLAIVLTQLSYYYSGLSDSELEKCLFIVANKRDGEVIYNDWIQLIPPSKRQTTQLSYEGLAMFRHDPDRRACLFGLLRKHKSVIDFWLSHVVFPREAQQFPGKIVMTSWDICYERNRHPLSGFSGTNDSWMLLPSQVSQQDLPELLNTNAERERDLLHEDNRNHKGLVTGVTCKEILEEMTKDGLHVLIDAGALMLEHNEQVAELWLETNASLEAVVYFNNDSELLVKCRADYEAVKGQTSRNENDIALELSPYRDTLEKCGVFLDDMHTRGTDLKFPEGTRACVTVGARMKYDKLSQSCMRMRKLGKGHFVTFYLSQEAHDKILLLKEKETGIPGGCVDTLDVINWVKENTSQYNQDGLLYWALGAKSYNQKLAAEDNFYFPLDTSISSYTQPISKPISRLNILASQCVDNEVTSLMEMYGLYAKREHLVDLTKHWFKMTQDKLQSKNENRDLPTRIKVNFDLACAAAVQRIVSLAPDKTVLSTMMEEEQERELDMEKEKEVEVEEERELEMPATPDEVVPSLHPNVEQLIIYGGEIVKKPGIVRLCEIFSKTSFWSAIRPECWSTEVVFATADFAATVKTSGVHSNTDTYLRPVEYLASTANPSGKFQLLVLSPFEVNELMPRFQKGETAMQLHMFLRRKFQNQDMLFQNPRLQVPNNPLRSPSSLNGESVAELIIASGTLYLVGPGEREAVARFLNQISSPQGLEVDGQVPENSIQIIKKIVACRHSVISENCHIMRLLNEADSKELDE